MLNEETPLEIAPVILEDLIASFRVMNALEFARHIHTMQISDAIKSEFIAAKVNQKPAEAEEEMSAAIERAVQKFWARLSDSAAGQVTG